MKQVKLFIFLYLLIGTSNLFSMGNLENEIVKLNENIDPWQWRFQDFLTFAAQKGSKRSIEYYDGQRTYSNKDSRGVPLDYLLRRIMNYSNGTFIEAGAFDGTTYSNSKVFEEYYGWTGILIEPSKNLFPELCKNRPGSRCFDCALGSFKENGTYAYGDFNGHPMSSFTGRVKEGKQEIKVLIRSLQSILDECNMTHINFFSLDTEGYELNILRGIDFDKTKFDYLLIEVYKRQYDLIVSFLDTKGYTLISNLSNYNRISNPAWDGTHNDYLFRRRDLIGN